MGLAASDTPPTPLRGRDEFWAEDPETKALVLRPKWLLRFSDNAAWHKHVIQFIREKASDRWHLLKKDVVDSLTHSELSDCLVTVFKTYADKYKLIVQARNQAGHGGQHIKEGKQRKDQTGRRQQRKIKVRTSMRSSAYPINERCQWLRRKARERFEVREKSQYCTSIVANT